MVDVMDNSLSVWPVKQWQSSSCNTNRTEK